MSSRWLIGSWQCEAIMTRRGGWAGRVEWRGAGVKPARVTAEYRGRGSKREALAAAVNLARTLVRLET